jgi:hypothetical protein
LTDSKYSVAHGGTKPRVDLVPFDYHRQPSRSRKGGLVSSICGTVVDNDHLIAEVFFGEGFVDPVEQHWKPSLLVIGRKNHPDGSLASHGDRSVWGALKDSLLNIG